MLAATAAQVNCVGGANGDVPTEISLADCDSVAQTLLSNNTYTIADMVEGDLKFGTSPVRRAYFAMGSTDLSADLNNVAKFVATNQYPNQANILNSEWGAVNNIRFLLSSIGYVAQNASGLGRNVYSFFVTGMESYGIVEQDGFSASFIYLPPQFSGPLAMNASVGYKFAMVPRLLNDLWIINMRCTKAN